MTAFSSIYTSVTGLFSFSTALNVISDNVANLNTPGFKANDVIFRDIASTDTGSRDAAQRDPFEIGDGVNIRGTTRRLIQGDFQSTNNATDLAIDGNGYFVVKQGDRLQYTRAGQFSFDTDGYLIDTATKARVQALDGSHRLSDVKIDKNRASAPVASTFVNFSGVLSTGATAAFDVNVPVIDASGASRTLKASFSKNTANSTVNSWQVTVTDENAKQLLSGEIRFQGDGSPADGFNTLQVMVPAGTTQSTITLNFGQPGSFDGARSFSSGTTSTLAVASSDGTALGVLNQVTVDRQGIVQFGFSNGKTETGQQLAIANFANPQSLSEVGSALFETTSKADVDQPTLGHATEGGLGALKPGNIELANVNLSQEFSNIIILQRAYQGSSQVLNISSQLLEQLYNNLGGRG